MLAAPFFVSELGVTKNNNELEQEISELREELVQLRLVVASLASADLDVLLTSIDFARGQSGADTEHYRSLKSNHESVWKYISSRIANV